MLRFFYCPTLLSIYIVYSMEYLAHSNYWAIYSSIYLVICIHYTRSYGMNFIYLQAIYQKIGLKPLQYQYHIATCSYISNMSHFKPWNIRAYIISKKVFYRLIHLNSYISCQNISFSSVKK